MANTSLTQASIGNGQTMNTEPAKYYNALVQKIESETGMRIVATEGTRTYARQKELYDLYRAGEGNPAWSPESPYAYHLSGRAVDVGSGVGFSNNPAYGVWRKYCGPYGFRETVQGETWHFEWRADWVGVDLSRAASGTLVEIPLPKDNDMRYIKYNDKTPTTINGVEVKNGDIFLWDAEGLKKVADGGAWDGAQGGLSGVGLELLNRNRLQFENLHRLVSSKVL